MLCKVVVCWQSGVFMNHVGSIGSGHPLSSSASKLSSALYEFNMSPSSHSPLHNNFPVSPRIGNDVSISTISARAYCSPQ